MLNPNELALLNNLLCVATPKNTKLGAECFWLQQNDDCQMCFRTTESMQILDRGLMKDF